MKSNTRLVTRVQHRGQDTAQIERVNVGVEEVVKLSKQAHETLLSRNERIKVDGRMRFERTQNR